MTSGGVVEKRLRATVSSVRRLAARFGVRRRVLRADVMGDHLRRDIGLLDGRITEGSARRAAERRG